MYPGCSRRTRSESGLFTALGIETVYHPQRCHSETGRPRLARWSTVTSLHLAEVPNQACLRPWESKRFITRSDVIPKRADPVWPAGGIGGAGALFGPGGAGGPGGFGGLQCGPNGRRHRRVRWPAAGRQGIGGAGALFGPGGAGGPGGFGGLQCGPNGRRHRAARRYPHRCTSSQAAGQVSWHGYGMQLE